MSAALLASAELALDGVAQPQPSKASELFELQDLLSLGLIKLQAGMDICARSQDSTEAIVPDLRGQLLSCQADRESDLGPVQRP